MNDRNLPPLPPLALSAKTQGALIVLRLFLGLMTMMAVFTFIHGLSG